MFAIASCLAACLDFDQYVEGTGGTSAGGAPEGGGPAGGAGGNGTCPSDTVVPATVCITGSVYDFNGKLNDDWSIAEQGSIGNGCTGTCATTTLVEGRLDLRTDVIEVIDECFASIDILSTDAQRTFLEIVPDGDPSEFNIPKPDRADNIEVAVVDDTIRFEVGKTALPALTLSEGVVVDQLRIQVRADTVVLEAFAGGEQVACTEQPRPDLLTKPVRAGFGIQGSAGQTASFDDYGGLGD